MSDFIKADQSKLRYDLIPASTTRALADILTIGAKKYAPDNWKKCTEDSRYIAAAMRHFEAWRGGELLDPESGRSHLHHVITNIAFLIEFENERLKTK